jgi:hypothetical protein
VPTYATPPPPTPRTQSLHTFGFRGEALSALAALGELSITTRTAEQAAAARLEFSADGRLAGSSGVARAVGTTVAVKGLFGTLPVRRQVRRAGRCGRAVAVWRLHSCPPPCPDMCRALRGCVGGGAVRSTIAAAAARTTAPSGVYAQRAARGGQAEAAAAAIRHHDATGVWGCWNAWGVCLLSAPLHLSGCLCDCQREHMCVCCRRLMVQAQLFASDQAGKSARTVLVSTSNAGGCPAGRQLLQQWFMPPSLLPACCNTGVLHPCDTRRAIPSLCPSGAGLAERVSAVLGSKVAALLVPLEVSMPDEGISITG